MSLSPWTSAEIARLHYAELLAAAEEYRLAKPLQDRARLDRAGSPRWRGLLGQLVRHLARPARPAAGPAESGATLRAP